MFNLQSLKKFIKLKNLDGYLIPKNDEFFQEYSNPNLLKILTKFSGSAGIALIKKNENFLFVDGRYTIQAKKESGSNFKVLEISKQSIQKLIDSQKTKIKIGYSPKLFTRFYLENKFGSNCQLMPCEENFVYKSREKINLFYFLDKKITGEVSKSKISRLMKILSKQKIDNIYISSPENVAWLLNIRGRDNPNSPIPNCQIIINKRQIYFFSDLLKIKKIKNKIVYKKISFYEKKDFLNVLKNLKGSKFFLDRDTCSIYDENLIKSFFNIFYGVDPCTKLKSIKNDIEINHTKKAHYFDGLALTKFLFNLKKSKFKFDELYLEKKLESIKKLNKNYLYPSFDTISGSGPNSAIIHYRANKMTNRKIRKKDLYLCDTGGQYKFGTTDVTRTVCFSKPSQSVKNLYTRVLKGHIAVINSTLNKYTNGAELDKKARYWLKEINLDYPHGTGHGVGFFLNVHEGPHSISKFNKVNFKKGMIVSNEPGIYKENKFGIRIENLIYVEKIKKKTFFKNLTFVPLDFDLINFKLIDKVEKKYLKNYHLKIYSMYKKDLNDNEKYWLFNLANQF